MTEQEAEALAARLTRIWELTKPVAVVQLNTYDGPIDQEKYNVVMWRITAHLPQGLWFEAYSPEWDDAPSLRLWSGDENAQERRALLSFMEYKDELFVDAKEGECWLPFFRRGCWLSGRPIEASAHEKAQWIQEFSQEELEAWNLKI